MPQSKYVRGGAGGVRAGEEGWGDGEGGGGEREGKREGERERGGKRDLILCWERTWISCLSRSSFQANQINTVIRLILYLLMQ